MPADPSRLPRCAHAPGSSGTSHSPLHRRDLLGAGVAALAGTLAAGGLPVAGLAAAAPGPRPARPRRSTLAPAIVTRAGWGADEAQRRPPAGYDGTVAKLVVHHTATPNGVADPAAWLRQIYAFQVSGVYTDLAYHFVVDGAGRIYEGRWARDYPPRTVHDGEDAWGRCVRGAATGGFNVATVAVALLGDFTTGVPTPAALDALVDVLTWKADRWGIDPLGASPYASSTQGWVTVPNIVAHRDCKATLCPGVLGDRLDEIRSRVARRLHHRGAGGYWVVSQEGRVAAFGDVPALDRVSFGGAITAAAAHPSGHGAWLAGADGGVFAFGDAPFRGSLAGRRMNAPVVAVAATPTGDGYWLAGADGGVFCFGDARFAGAVHAPLRAPITAMTPSPSGSGYLLAAADGGVFVFGDARFAGSASPAPLNAPVVAIAGTPSGGGYWLAAADGGVFAFGDAPFLGSWPLGGDGRVVAMVASATGHGYVLLADDGRVATFGDAVHHGHDLRLERPVAIAGRVRPRAPKG